MAVCDGDVVGAIGNFYGVYVVYANVLEEVIFQAAWKIFKQQNWRCESTTIAKNAFRQPEK